MGQVVPTVAEEEGLLHVLQIGTLSHYFAEEEGLLHVLQIGTLSHYFEMEFFE
jgi:hypothetical protein